MKNRQKKEMIEGGIGEQDRWKKNELMNDSMKRKKERKKLTNRLIGSLKKGDKW